MPENFGLGQLPGGNGDHLVEESIGRLFEYLFSSGNGRCIEVETHKYSGLFTFSNEK